MPPSASLIRSRAQSIIETVVGLSFLVPIVLFLFDIGCLVIANTANDNLAKQSARAAAGAVNTNNIGTFAAGKSAADATIDKYRTTIGATGFIKIVNLQYMDYNNGKPNIFGTVQTPANTSPGTGNVSVVTSMTVQCPVPFPGFDTTRVFLSRAVEPIVSLPP